MKKIFFGILINTLLWSSSSFATNVYISYGTTDQGAPSLITCPLDDKTGGLVSSSCLNVPISMPSGSTYLDVATIASYADVNDISRIYVDLWNGYDNPVGLVNVCQTDPLNGQLQNCQSSFWRADQLTSDIKFAKFNDLGYGYFLTGSGFNSSLTICVMQPDGTPSKICNDNPIFATHIAPYQDAKGYLHVYTAVDNAISSCPQSGMTVGSFCKMVRYYGDEASAHPSLTFHAINGVNYAYIMLRGSDLKGLEICQISDDGLQFNNCFMSKVQTGYGMDAQFKTINGVTRAYVLDFGDVLDNTTYLNVCNTVDPRSGELSNCTGYNINGPDKRGLGTMTFN